MKARAAKKILLRCMVSVAYTGKQIERAMSVIRKAKQRRARWLSSGQTYERQQKRADRRWKGKGI